MIQVIRLLTDVTTSTQTIAMTTNCCYFYACFLVVDTASMIRMIRLLIAVS